MYKYAFIFTLSAVIIYSIFRYNVYTDKTIILGASLPKTGIMKAWGRSVEIGSNAYFRFVNERKLLPGDREIKLVALDDKYEPDLTLENTKQLLARKDLFALYGFVGTPTVKSIFDIVIDKNIPFVAPFTGASFLREKSYNNIVNFRASYDEEIEKIVKYLYNEKGIKKFSVFYQNDVYGEEGYVSLIKALKNKNLKLSSEGTYKRNTLSIKHAFKEIKSSKPEAVLMVGSYKANSLFIKRAIKDEDLSKVIFCNISFSDANEIIKNFDEKTLNNIIFSEVVHSSNDLNIDAIEEYKYLMNRYYPDEKLGFISLESFLVAKITVNAIKEASLNLTPENFLRKLKETSNDVIKGIDVKFKNNELLNRTYLFKYVNSKFVKIDNE